MRFYLIFNDNSQCLKKWCEREHYIYNENEYSLYTPQKKFFIAEYYDEYTWPEYGLYLNHDIHIELQFNLEDFNLFFSLVKYVIINTCSDMLVFREDAIPFIHRKNSKILVDNVFWDEERMCCENIGELRDNLFSELDYKIVNIDEYFGFKE